MVSFGEKNLGKNLKTLLIMHTIFIVATSLSDIFVNIFLWRSSNSLSLIVHFNIFYYISAVIAAVLSGWIGKNRSFKFSLILGMLFYTAFYIFLFYCRSNVVNYVHIAGIIRGAGVGFYWLAFNVLGYDLSNNKNRDFFLGCMMFLSTGAAAFPPFISGYILSNLKGFEGYGVVFALSFILLIISSITCFFIPRSFQSSNYQLISIVKSFIKDNDCRKVLICESIKTFREVAILFIPIFLFILSARESVIGHYSLWTSIIGTISFYIAGILIKPHNRVNYLFIGALGSTLIGGIFIFDSGIAGYWIFGILNAVLAAPLLIPQNAIGYAVTSSVSDSSEKRIEFFVARELFLFIGRMVGLGLLLMIATYYFLIPYFILIMFASQIFLWFLMKNINGVSK